MAKTNKKCSLCGREYYYCSHCTNKSPAYMLHSCSENCRDINEIVSNYCADMISQKEAASRLQKCDLSDIARYKKGARDAIKRIMENTNPVKEAVVEPKKAVVVKPQETQAVKKEPVTAPTDRTSAKVEEKK